MKKTRVIIPAAGKGCRLNCSDIPKAMFEILGKPLLGYVLQNTSFIPPEETFIIVGYKKEKITSFFTEPYNYIEQKEQLGTGHAVMMCEDAFRGFDGNVIVTFGDMPLFKKEILEKLLSHHEKENAVCTLLSAEKDAIRDWARIIRDENGSIKAIVEAADLEENERRGTDLFAGVLVFDSKALFSALPELSCQNNQGEYYLTELPVIFASKGLKVTSFPTDDITDLCGVNTREDLAVCEKVLKARFSK